MKEKVFVIYSGSFCVCVCVCKCIFNKRSKLLEANFIIRNRC